MSAARRDMKGSLYKLGVMSIPIAQFSMLFGKLYTILLLCTF